jgi:hypothetical protein
MDEYNLINVVNILNDFIEVENLEDKRNSLNWSESSTRKFQGKIKEK